MGCCLNSLRDNQFYVHPLFVLQLLLNPGKFQQTDLYGQFLQAGI